MQNRVERLGLDSGLPIRDLIDRCLDGESREQSWRELVRRYDPVLRAYGRRVSTQASVWHGNAHGPEDLAGEVWLKLCKGKLRALRSFAGTTEAEWRSYLHRIVINKVLDGVRRSRAKKMPPIVEKPTMSEVQAYVDSFPDSSPDPQRSLEAVETRERFEGALRNAWRDSPHRDRNVLICQLHFLDGLSAVKIACVAPVGLTNKGVEKVIAKGKRILQKAFGGPGARSRDLGRGEDEEEAIPGRHWRDETEIQAFVLALPAVAADREAHIAHLSRCDACRKRMVAVHEAMLCEPTSEEQRHYAAEHPDPQRRVDEVIQRLGGAPARTRGWIGSLVSRPTRSRGILVMASAAAVVALLWIGLRDERPLPSESRLSAGRDVGTLDFLGTVASDYPLQAFLPLRLGQSFAAETAAVLRGAEEASTTDARLRAAEKQLAERRAVAWDTWSGPEKVAYHNALAHLKLARGRLESAREHYEEALKIAPDNAVALIGLAIVSFERAKDESMDAEQRDVLLRAADESLRKVDSRSVHYPRAVYNRIEIALARGDVELANSLWDTYTALDDDPAWVSRVGRELDGAKAAQTGG